MNIFSMTGFNRSTFPISGGIVHYEIRTVNHRFLEISCYLPQKFKHLDFAIREMIRQQLVRGKCEVSISFEETFSAEKKAAFSASEGSDFLSPDPNAREIRGSVALDEALLQSLRHQEEAIKHYFPEARSLSVAEILDYPGIIKENKNLMSEWESALLKGLNESLEKIKEMRAKEGDALAKIILQKLLKFEEGMNHISQLLPNIREALQQRMRDQLEKFLKNTTALSAGSSNSVTATDAIPLTESVAQSVSSASKSVKLKTTEPVLSPTRVKSEGYIDEHRFEQELVYWLQKIDVTEEVDRLYTHIHEMKNIVKEGGVLGRKLDFLLQEMQRETNTLSSKTPSALVSKESVELKVLIEQIREQIQNLE